MSTDSSLILPDPLPAEQFDPDTPIFNELAVVDAASVIAREAARDADVIAGMVPHRRSVWVVLADFWKDVTR